MDNISSRPTINDFNDVDPCGRPTVFNFKINRVVSDSTYLFPIGGRDKNIPVNSCECCANCTQEVASLLFQEAGINTNHSKRVADHLLRFGIESNCSSCWDWAFKIAEAMELHSRMLLARLLEDSALELEMSRRKSAMFASLGYNKV